MNRLQGMHVGMMESRTNPRMTHGFAGVRGLACNWRIENHAATEGWAVDRLEVNDVAHVNRGLIQAIAAGATDQLVAPDVYGSGCSKRLGKKVFGGGIELIGVTHNFYHP